MKNIKGFQYFLVKSFDLNNNNQAKNDRKD